MKKKFLFFIAIAMLLGHSIVKAQLLWGSLKPGLHSVGFNTMQQLDKSRNRALTICMWYPASDASNKIAFSEYLYTNMNGNQNGEKLQAENQFKPLVRIMTTEEINDDQYYKALTNTVAAIRNAPLQPGRYPTILMREDPASLSVTNEFLASHGYMVMSVFSNEDAATAAEPLNLTSATKDLEWLLEFAQKMPYVDADRIGAIGFGGSAGAPALLAMQSKKLKALVSLETGLFSPGDQLSRSEGYNPKNLKLPTLHIVTQNTRAKESDEAIKEVEGPNVYRYVVRNENIKHHDFSIYGRIANMALKMRGNDALAAELAFVSAHDLILEFLDSQLMQRKKQFKVQGTYTEVTKIS